MRMLTEAGSENLKFRMLSLMHILFITDYIWEDAVFC